MKAFLYAIFKPLTDVLLEVLGIIPNLLAAAAVVIIGYGAARLSEAIIAMVLRLINFDVLSDKIGFSNILSKGDVALTPTLFISRALYWLILLIFIMAGVDALRLEITSNLVSIFFLYLPKLFAALIIIIFGYYAANFLARAALLAAVNANISYSKVLSEIIRIFIIILAFTMGFEQLGIAGRTLMVTFFIVLGGVVLALALALAIALGLGGRDAAKEFLEGGLKKKEKKDKDGIRHI